jgi:hypothetical protein
LNFTGGVGTQDFGYRQHQQKSVFFSRGAGEKQDYPVNAQLNCQVNLLFKSKLPLDASRVTRRVFEKVAQTIFCKIK